MPSAGAPQRRDARWTDVVAGDRGAQRLSQPDAAYPVREATAATDDDLGHLPTTGPRARRMTANLDKGTDLNHEPNIERPC